MIEARPLTTRLSAYSEFSALDLPKRSGPRPLTTDRAPHSQRSQHAPPALQRELRDHALSMPGVRPGLSRFAGDGTVAFFLDAPPNAPVLDGVWWEWAHLHPEHDGSLHMTVPPEMAARVVALGWGEFHYLVMQGALPPILVMLYGPRDRHELDVASRLLEAAYLAAGGSFATLA